MEPWLDDLWPALELFRSGIQNGLLNNGLSVDKSSNEVIKANNNLKEGLSEVTMAGTTTTVTLPACPERYMLVTFQEVDNDSSPTLLLPPLPSSAGPLLPATLVHSKRLTSDQAPKHYYETELSVQGEFEYRAGDTVAVVCPNPEKEIQELCRRLQLDEKWHLPCQVSIDPNTKKKKATLPAWLPIKASLGVLF